MRAAYDHIARAVAARRQRHPAVSAFRPGAGGIGRALLTEGSPGPLHHIRDTRERR